MPALSPPTASPLNSGEPVWQVRKHAVMKGVGGRLQFQSSFPHLPKDSLSTPALRPTPCGPSHNLLYPSLPASTIISLNSFLLVSTSSFIF